MSALRACPSCQQHVRDEDRCTFCGADMADVPIPPGPTAIQPDARFAAPMYGMPPPHEPPKTRYFIIVAVIACAGAAAAYVMVN